VVRVVSRRLRLTEGGETKPKGVHSDLDLSSDGQKLTEYLLTNCLTTRKCKIANK